MNASRRFVLLAGLLASVLAFSGCMEVQTEQARTAAGAGPSKAEQEAHDIALDAYVYGYPLVTMELTRRALTNVARPEAKKAPMGQLALMRSYPTPDDREVTAPNADTLYTMAWLDVGAEPWILSVPDMQGRYYLLPLLSGWTDVFEVPGKRTTGTRAHRYAITGPGWTGKLPKGVVELKSPTALVWLLGRIYATGTPADNAAVHRLQDRFRLVPLSAYGKRYTPPAGEVDPGLDDRTPVREQVNRLDTATYFNLLAALMKANPPAAADAPMVARMAKIGLVPGQPFDPGKLEPAIARALDGVPTEAFEHIMAHFKEAGTHENGWLYTTDTGVYGTDYLQRALITAIGLGANRPQDAVYPTSETDADGQPYDGAKRYVMHFDKGQLPPAAAFWSLTMYDDQYFFVPNALNRYTLSSRSALKHNKDGSVDLYLQHESPGKAMAANWLPAPAGRFILMLRLYWPRQKDPSILDGTWRIPPVRAVE